MLVPDDLVLCLGAIGTATFAERVRAARENGFAGISMWMSHYDEARAEGLSHAEMRATLDGAGVKLAMLEYITAWASGPAEREAIPEETARICGIAEELGSDTVLAVTMAPAIDPAEATAGLAIACDVAARHGQRLGVEFLPWTGIPNLAAAWPLVRDADRPNAGLVLDSWHWFRSGPDPDLLRSIPGEKVIHLQISDAPAQPEPDVVAETIGKRLLPGEGAIDLPGLLRILDETGRQGPTAVEVFSDWLRSHPTLEGARLALSRPHVLAGAGDSGPPPEHARRPPRGAGETLLEATTVRMAHRSTGHASPEGFWYDQPQREFVLVVRGRARLEFDDGETPSLESGGWVDIPAHRRHRVASTDSEEPTVWLAVHY